MQSALTRIEVQAANGTVALNDLEALLPLWEKSRAALLDWENTGRQVSRSARPA